MTDIRMHDLVALLEDLPATHYETGRPLTLCPGEVGTVVMTYDGSAVEVEFSADDGCAYARLPIPVDKLLVLRHRSDRSSRRRPTPTLTSFRRPDSGMLVRGP